MAPWKCLDPSISMVPSDVLPFYEHWATHYRTRRTSAVRMSILPCNSGKLSDNLKIILMLKAYGLIAIVSSYHMREFRKFLSDCNHLRNAKWRPYIYIVIWQTIFFHRLSRSNEHSCSFSFFMHDHINFVLFCWRTELKVKILFRQEIGK